MDEHDMHLLDLIERIWRAPGVRCNELAQQGGVSERTIRNRIHRANELMQGVARVANRRGQGYSLDILDEEGFEAWRSRQRDLLDGSRVPATSRERKAYLLNDLLERTDWITLDDLSELLFVSRKCVSRELRDVEQYLATYDLSIEKRPHYGIRVRGGELNRRLCLASVAIEHAGDGPWVHDDEAWQSHRKLLNDVSACVSQSVVDEEIEIGAVALQNLVVHMTIAILRMRSGCYMPMDAGFVSEIKSSSEYASAQRLAKKIESHFKLTLPEEEVAYIAIHLAGKQTITAQEADDVVDGQVWDLVTKMLEEVRRVYHFDFTDDLELRMNLARHLVPLLVRLKFHMSARNPILRDIRSRFPLAYSMALDSASVIKGQVDSELTDDEIGYIAMAYAIALERRKSSLRRKKNILLVCASGAGSAKLLAIRFHERFGASLNEMRTCDVGHIDREDFSAIDYVFTTVPIKQKLPVPVCEVGHFLDEHDALLVQRVLDDQGDFGSGADALRAFSRSLFFTHVPCTTKREVIHLLCEAARASEEVPEEFEELVLQREEAAETSFGNRVALPHPYVPVSGRTFVAVALLDGPIEWNHHPVQAVFLISIIKDACEDLDAFYREMSGLLADEQSISRLVADQRFEVLTALLHTRPSDVSKERQRGDDWGDLLD